MEPEELAVTLPKQGKPRSVKTKVENIKNKKSKPGDIDSDTLGKFVQGIFGVVAVVGGAHWVIDETESEAISDPLATMLNKMNKKKKDNLAALMSPILLVTAIGTVIVPRAMITIEQMKMERERLKYAAATDSFPLRQNRPANVESNSIGYEEPKRNDHGIVIDGEAAFARVSSAIPASD